MPEARSSSHELPAQGDGGRTPTEYLTEVPSAVREPYSRTEDTVETPPAGLPNDSDAYATVGVAVPCDDPYATQGNALRTLANEVPRDPRWPRIAGHNIIRLLGKGGMGIVYLARHLQLDRLVALKMIRTDRSIDNDTLARFRSEAEAVARLKHPHIVQLYEIGEAEDRPFFSLEYVEQGSLDTRLAKAPLHPREAAALVEVLARAMHHAHQHGIVHRDLKPANVLLAGSDSTLGIALTSGGQTDHLTPKIADFGLAKRLGDESVQTQYGEIIGTPSFMAPEQIPETAEGRVKDVGPAADIYALGAILYDGLVGRPPFKGATALETLNLVLHQEPIPPRQLQPEVKRDLETICLKCLDKDPTKRYADAEALADDLRRFLNREPIQARPISTGERLAKWARRKPAAASLVAVALVAVLALATALGLFVHSIWREADILDQRLQAQQQVQERISLVLRQAQQHETAGDWQAANADLESAVQLLDAHPEMPAEERRAEVAERLASVRGKLQDQDASRQAGKRLQDFQVPYDKALFFQTGVTGLDTVQNRGKTLAAVKEALAIYGLHQEDMAGGLPARLESDRQHLDGAEHTRLVSACYELLLIWTEIEADNQSTRNALELLARAARLGKAMGLETRTFHLLKARVHAQRDGKPFDAAAAERDAPPAAGRLDWFLAGMQRYRQEQFVESIDACAQVLQHQPGDYWAHYVTGLCQLRLGQWANARAELTTCLNLKPDFLWPRLLRGFAASEMGVKHADKRLAAAEFAAAEKDLDVVLNQDKSELAQYVGLANRGVLNIRRERWDAAFRDLRDAVKANPEGVEGYLNLALAHQGLKQWPEALAALNQAAQRAPHLPIVYESRAKLHLRRKDWTAARADFEQAIAREPKGSKSDRLVTNLVELGKLLDRENKYTAALASYDLALKLNPAFGLAHRFRAETMLRANRLADAAEALDQYLATAREVPANVYYARGLVFAQEGKAARAIEMYTLALAQLPDDIAIRGQRGWAYLMTDAARLGLEDFETCLRIDQDNTDALVGRGSARIRLKQLDTALADAETAEKLGPLAERLWYHLARLYAQAAAQLDADSRTGLLTQRAAAEQRGTGARDKALDCLRRTLEALPAERRSAFWRERVETDSAFAVIRATGPYASLALRYAGSGP